MKKALIAVNYIGFVYFLWDDIDLLKEMGYQVYLAADNVKQESQALEILAEKGVTFIDVPLDSKSPLTRKNWEAFNIYRKLLAHEKFDLIHCHTPIVGLFLRMAARRYRRKGAKVLYTTHGLAYTHLSGRKEYLVYHTIESFASRFCDAIITINREDYDNARKLHCQKVFHINGMGVDTAKFRDVKIDKQEYRTKLGIPTGKIMILSVGELSVRKNHTIIVEALSRLKNKEDYVYAICGHEMTAGGTTQAIRDLSQKEGVQVIFLGFRRDIPEVIHCSDIGAIPSVREGLGLAGIESLSAGVPLVGTDVQGIKEYIVDGKTGYLYNPYDAEGFAKGIEALSNETTRRSMEADCKEIVQKFDVSVSVAQRREIYREMLR